MFVALAGNIGAGKTTAANLLASYFGFELFTEPVLENRFLKLYYEDMARWSFTLQMEFLLKRLEHHNQVAQHPGPCIQDRTLIEDPEVFAKYLHGLGHMRDEELDLYFDYFKRFHDNIQQPDKIVLLHTPDVNELMRRIAERGREEESDIGADFLRGLNGYYETFDQVARVKYDIDVLKIDVTDRDIREGREQEEFIELVDDFLHDELPPTNELPFEEPPTSNELPLNAERAPEDALERVSAVPDDAADTVGE
jgi:deoxyadenosine/deoxycytidine kinase